MKLPEKTSAKRLCIVGLGLIGGSLAAALKARGFSGQISAVVRRDEVGRRALELGIVDSYTLALAEGVAQADIIMLAVPMLSMRTQLDAMRDVLPEHAVVTDAGSVKRSFIDDARDVFGTLERVVPGHPIAGSENSGIEASDAHLFEGKRVILTPLEETHEDAIEAVRTLWQVTGAEVETLEPEYHDRVLAATSHLPHVLAFSLVDTLATHQEVEEIFRYAAGGFKDFTRIASSDAVMWRDVSLTNRQALLESMDSFSAHLETLRKAIEQGDGDAIEAIFKRARAARDAYTS
ncbi:MAG: prephenate dehydrogenase/arogenate dehydrogenase family protein [Granulosicoccus sp.]